ncbi:glutaminase [Aureibacter tunicatorum]|uniref:glutaminase n=1 Tax=Aureibacter tunicatorum TaxID=866807 RepID=UPI0030CA59EA
MNYQSVLDEIIHELAEFEDKGEVASYIPELAKVSPEKFGVYITGVEGQECYTGDYQERFSIQSISKVFALALAFKNMGESLWSRVGVEPSGDPFNSLVQLEHEKGIPRNPLINAGALVVCDVLISIFKNPKDELSAFVENLMGGPVNFNLKVFLSEKKHAYVNAALINLMKAFGNIKNDVEEVLDFYFYQCSMEMSCQELSKAFLLFANKGKIPLTNEQMIKEINSRRINAIMQTCGFYDEAGEFAYKVGLPGKSGVGGGIIAVNPGIYSVAVWSPKLNANGNSAKGMKFLEMLSAKTGSSIF